MNQRSIRAFLALAIAVLSSATAAAQDLPQKIRGYKVHVPIIYAGGRENRPPKNEKAAAELEIGDVTIADVGLTGITLEAAASVTAFDQNGQVDFVTFRDFRVNAIAIEIEEYRHAFAFKRDKQLTLPAPVRVLIRGSGLAKAAFRETINSNSEWTITGRIFVFGKFKKFGLSFKRVVPVQIEIKIPNPIKSFNLNEN